MEKSIEAKQNYKDFKRCPNLLFYNRLEKAQEAEILARENVCVQMFCVKTSALEQEVTE